VCARYYCCAMVVLLLQKKKKNKIRKRIMNSIVMLERNRKLCWPSSMVLMTSLKFLQSPALVALSQKDKIQHQSS